MNEFIKFYCSRKKVTAVQILTVPKIRGKFLQAYYAFFDVSPDFGHRDYAEKKVLTGVLKRVDRALMCL